MSAVIAWLLANGYRPETTNNEALLRQAIKGQWNECGFRNLSKKVQAFLQSCLAYEPVGRPSPVMIARLEIVRNIKWGPNQLLRPSKSHQPCEMQQRKELPFDGESREHRGNKKRWYMSEIEWKIQSRNY